MPRIHACMTGRRCEAKGKRMRGAGLRPTGSRGRRGLLGGGLRPTGQGQGGNGLTSAEFTGEKHPPLIVKTNSFPYRSLKRGNFEGPGTHVLKRVKRGDEGITYSDNVSKAHDLRYMLAGSRDDIRAADKKFIASLGDSSKGNAINKKLARTVMQGKVFAEDKGLLSRDKFSGQLPNKMSDDDRNMLQKELGKMEQRGLGHPASSIVKEMKAMALGSGVTTPMKPKPMAGSGVKPKKLTRAEIRRFVVVILKSWATLHRKHDSADSRADRLMKDSRGQGVMTIKAKLTDLLLSDLNGEEMWKPHIRKDVNNMWNHLRKGGQSGNGLQGGSFWGSIKNAFGKVGRTISDGAKAVAKVAPKIGKFAWDNKKEIVEGIKTGVELAGML